MKEEAGLLMQQAPQKALGVIVVRSDTSDPFRFDFRDGPTFHRARMQELFSQAATDAGLLLIYIPDNVTPRALWIHRLWSYCLANCPEYVSHQTSNGGGSLERVCEASATCCARLDRRAMERGDSKEDPFTYVILEAGENADKVRKRAAPNAETHTQSEKTKDEREAERITEASEAGPSSTNTKERIDTFISKILAEESRKITRTDMWTLAGYRDATEFERFQREDKKPPRARDVTLKPS